MVLFCHQQTINPIQVSRPHKNIRQGPVTPRSQEDNQALVSRLYCHTKTIQPGMV
jgi:hypothetical protein